MVSVTVKKSIVGVWQVAVVIVVNALLVLRNNIYMVTPFPFRHNDAIPGSYAVVPRIIFCFLPGVEERRAVFVVAVHHVTFTSTYFSVHEEISTITFVFVLLSQGKKLRQKCVVVCKTRNVSGSVNAETVNTHSDKFAVAIHKVVAHVWVFRVEVHAVTGNLCIPARIVVPIPVVANVVPVVVHIVVYTVCILHICQASTIL